MRCVEEGEDLGKKGWFGGGIGIEELVEDGRGVWKGGELYVESWKLYGEGEGVILLIDIASVM